MKITRGDTSPIYKFQRKDGNKNVIQTQAKEMYFTVKQNEYTKESLIQKKLVDGIEFNAEDFYYRFQLKPEDTETLNYGTYKYDIEVVTDEYVKTIAKGELIIDKEVTFQCNKG